MARQKKQQILPPQVDELRRRIETWRKTRTKRSAMPEDLWQAAAALARTHGVYQIARALGVHFDGLKARATKARKTKKTMMPPPPAEFVELASFLPAGPTSPAKPVVELSRADGTRLTIRMVSQDLDIESLVNTFVGRSV